MKVVKRDDNIIEVQEPAKNLACILTPHFLQRLAERSNGKDPEVVKQDLFEVIHKIIDKFETLESNQLLCTVKNNRQFIYRKVFNERRNRNEVEFVSYTPNNFIGSNTKLVTL